MKSNLWQLMVILAVAGLLSGCSSEASPGAEDTPEVTPSPVETLVVSHRVFVDRFEVLGTAEPKDSVQVASDLPGKILGVYAEEGDAVTRGQRLFRIDTSTDEAGQDVLRTQLEAAERELDRMERLRAEGLTTEQQLDAARTDVAQARENLRQSQVSIGRNSVTSPIKGYVATRFADDGEFANAGAPLAEVIDYETIVVYAQVPESQIRYLSGNSDPTVDVDFPALDMTEVGEIVRVALRPSPTTRTYRAEIHIDNEDLAIRPGMRARVHFERERYDQAVVVPRDSILEGFDGREVMVVPGDATEGSAEIRRIETGPGTRDEIVVLDGLEAGDRLILRGHRGLVNNARVEVVDENHQDREGDHR